MRNPSDLGVARYVIVLRSSVSSHPSCLRPTIMANALWRSGQQSRKTPPVPAILRGTRFVCDGVAMVATHSRPSQCLRRVIAAGCPFTRCSRAHACQTSSISVAQARDVLFCLRCLREYGQALLRSWVFLSEPGQARMKVRPVLMPTHRHFGQGAARDIAVDKATPPQR